MAVEDQPLLQKRIDIAPQAHVFRIFLEDTLNACTQITKPRWPTFLRPPIADNTTWWYGNINPFSIAYAFRPRLRSRLTLGGLTFPRKPWAFGGRVSRPSLATHTGILSSLRSTGPSGPASLPRKCSPTNTRLLSHSIASVMDLSPVTLSAQNHLTSELLRTL